MTNLPLSTLDFREIDTKLRTLLGRERDVQVDFLLHLDAFDRLHGHEGFGYAKLWDYCRRELGLLEGKIWRRVHTMDLLRRFPAIEPRLRDGRVSMTALCKLEKILDEGTLEEMLDSVVGKSTREIDVLVASFNAPVPVPRKAATIRKLPVRKIPIALARSGPPEPEPAEQIAAPGLNLHPAPDPNLITAPAPNLGAVPPPTDLRTLVEIGGHGDEMPIGASPFVDPQRRARVTPLSKEQYSIKLFVPREFIEKLEAAKKLVSHQVPYGEVEKVIAVALDRLLRDGARRGRARESRDRKRNCNADRGKSADRYIPVALRRQVRERDGRRCCWVLENGEVCGSQHQLQIDHILALALGGATTLENLRLVCRAHNLMNARLSFGREHMARFGV